MRVETSLTVPRTAIVNGEARTHLILQARERLVRLGLANEGALAEEPTVMVSAGDRVSNWVDVTFRWEWD